MKTERLKTRWSQSLSAPLPPLYLESDDAIDFLPARATLDDKLIQLELDAPLPAVGLAPRLGTISYEAERTSCESVAELTAPSRYPNS